MHKTITIDLVLRLNLTSQEQESLNREQQWVLPRLQKVMEAKTLHLEGEDIEEIDNLELFSHIQTLFLQYNRIQVISNLDHLFNLQYLSLEGNQITFVQNLTSLSNLIYLNISNNQILSLAPYMLPQNLVIMKASGNPCSAESDYRSGLVAGLELLEELDGIMVTPQERMGGEPLEQPVQPPFEIDRLQNQLYMTEDEEVLYSKLTEAAWDLVQKSKSRVKDLENKISKTISKSQLD